MTETSPRKQRGKGKPWPKGTSGNPRGRKPGSGLAGELRKAIADKAGDVLAALVAKALEGDVAAARVLLDRVLPALKAESAPVNLPGLTTGTLMERADTALAAVGNGEVAPDTAAALVAAVGTLARIQETTELADRITALEERINDKPE